jgi:hypothetical protein
MLTGAVSGRWSKRIEVAVGLLIRLFQSLSFEGGIGVDQACSKIQESENLLLEFWRGAVFGFQG